jgi:hypothetical protein
MLLNLFCIATAIGGILTCLIYGRKRERGQPAKGWSRANLAIWIAAIIVVVSLHPEPAMKWLCIGGTTLGAWWTSILVLAHDTKNRGGWKPRRRRPSDYFEG